MENRILMASDVTRRTYLRGFDKHESVQPQRLYIVEHDRSESWVIWYTGTIEKLTIVTVHFLCRNPKDSKTKKIRSALKPSLMYV